MVFGALGSALPVIAIICFICTADPAAYLAWIWSPSFTHTVCLILGVALVPFAKYAVRLISSARDANECDGNDSAIYGLGHGRLNIVLPPPTMWMNMGYWEKTSDLPTACRALLSEVLLTAGLLLPTENKPVASPSECRALNLIDLGFGCGDQTIYLLREIFNTTSTTRPPTSIAYRTKEKHSNGPAPLTIVSYVGITLDRKQYRFARSRLVTHGLLDDDANGGMVTFSNGKPPVCLFCADAAAPATWSTELKSAMHPISSPDDVKDYLETWILALDTLYHFRPTRAPILQHAYKSLHASFMAFDLVLSSRTTLLQRLLLRLICWLSDTPFSNFITESSYRELLINVGYSDQNIVIRDVSRHVFAPLSKFLKERESRLAMIGLGIGGFKVAGWMFGWWGESGIVRGVIVVAKR